MFEQIQDRSGLWAVAACIAASALVMAQVAKAISWYAQGTQKVSEVTEWKNWG